MDAIVTKDFLAITGYTHAILEMDEWIRDKSYFYPLERKTSGFSPRI